MNQESLPTIILVSLRNEATKLFNPSKAIKTKLVCKLKITVAELRVYNGINQYILTVNSGIKMLEKGDLKWLFIK